MTQKESALKKIFCAAMKKYRLVQFLYRSDKDKSPRLRIVEPYLVVIADNGEGPMKLVGYPANRKPDTGELGHYLFDKLDIDNIEILPQTFNRLRVSEKAVYDTPTVTVLCKVVFSKQKA